MRSTEARLGRGRRAARARSAGAVFVTALAAFTVPRRAEADELAVVWYRATAECPDGDAFLARVAERSRRARLARAGDRVDFVVTLDGGAAKGTGRLERQTEDGIVAIREVSGDSCAEVADALALGLALALERRDAPPAPDAPPATEAAPPKPPAPDDTTAGAEPPGDPAREGAGESSPGTRSEEEELELDLLMESADPGVRRRAQWGLGGDARFRTGIAPQLLGGASLHLEWRREGGVGLRLTGFGTSGTGETSRGDLAVSVWGGSFELCPVRVARARLTLDACGGVELGRGAVHGGGPGGTRGNGAWAAVELLERLRWPVDRGGPSLEVELGLAAPLTRYRIVAENPREELHRVAPVGLLAGFGLHMPLP